MKLANAFSSTTIALTTKGTSKHSQALHDLGLFFDFWDGSLRGYVDLPILSQYLEGAVIWAMPDLGYLLDIEAQDGLGSYLDSGGRLFLSGQNVGSYLRFTSFYKDHLHATYVQNDTNIFALKGVTGDPITDGLGFAITSGDGAYNQFSPSEINPIFPAVSILTYDDTVPLKSALIPRPPRGKDEPEPISLERLAPHPSNEEGMASAPLPQGDGEVADISSSGTGALRVDTGVYRLVYFAFGFEAIDSFEMRKEVMSRVIGWLSAASIQGKVEFPYPGMMEGFGARVHLRCGDAQMTTISQPDGTFTFRNAPEGTCEVEVRAPAHLPAKKANVVVKRGGVTSLPPVRLSIGDLNGDGRNDAQDLSLLAASFGRAESEWPTEGLWELKLAPGMNLVSLPRNPAEGDINHLIPLHAPVDLICTVATATDGTGIPPCDSDEGPWLSARRSPETGRLEGTLRTIDAAHAYWIRAQAPTSLQIAIPPLGPHDPLPTIPVIGGQWNLIPVLSLQPTENITQGTELDADEYLGNNWSRAFTYDRGRWFLIVPGADPDGDPDTVDDAVQIGRGYSVFFTRDDTEIP